VRVQQVRLSQYLERSAAGALPEEDPLEASRRTMDSLVDEYLNLPVFPGERALWGDILRQRNAFNEATAHSMSEAGRGRLEAASAVSRSDVSRTAEALISAFTRDIEFNASHSHDLALRIRQLRGRSMAIAYALDAICALITMVSAFVLSRAMRAHADLSERHRRTVEERASELEQFAGRAAHDILSPLNAVSLALQLVCKADDGEGRARYLARGTSALGVSSGWSVVCSSSRARARSPI
jgi:hypothetical protein